MQWYVYALVALVSTVRCIDQKAGSAYCLYLVRCLFTVTPILCGPTKTLLLPFLSSLSDFPHSVYCVVVLVVELWIWDLGVCVLPVAHACVAIFSFCREKMWSAKIIGWLWSVIHCNFSTYCIRIIIAFVPITSSCTFSVLIIRDVFGLPYYYNTSIFP